MSLWQRLVGDRPIVTRLVVAVAAAMAVVLVVTAAFVWWRVSYALDRQLDQDLDAWQEVVERSVQAGQDPPGDTPGETFQVYDVRGRLVGGDREVQRLLDANDVDDARGGEQRFDLGRFLPAPKHAYRVDATLVRTPSGHRVVAAAISRRKHDEALRELLLQLAIADLLTLAAASFVGYRTARAALDPVERYRRAAEDAGDDAGGPPVRLLPVGDGDDELTRLGHTFNDLLVRLEHGQRRERQFLADASHELRTPLSLMRTELEWARHRPRDATETAEVIASVTGQVDRLVDLANALLDLEELRGTGPVPRDDVRLGDLLGEAVAGVVPVGEREDVAVAAPDEVVHVNRRWLGLAVGNLVANARRHGGGAVAVGATIAGGRLRVEVRDEGPGFPEDFAATAFDRFTRAEASRTTPGSGLGLALVSAVATAHGGRAFVVPAEPGRAGTCVVLEITGA